MEELRLSGYRESLALWTRRIAPPEHNPGLRALAFEYSSRGDRAVGRLWLPMRPEGECPLVLLQPEGGCASTPALGARWAERGAAIASIDLPLHGSRADPKLATLVGTPFEPGTLASADALRFELLRQAVIDLERALDALCTLDEIDRDRIAYAGLGLGALIGSIFCGLDPRPCAAALAGAGAGLAPPSLDPGTYVGRFSPRPLLLIHTEGSPRIPREAALALSTAAGEGVEQRWLANGSDAAEAPLDPMWDFLADAIALEASPR